MVPSTPQEVNIQPRSHTKLRMSPAAYAASLRAATPLRKRKYKVSVESRGRHLCYCEPDLLLSIPFTEGLICLSVRCMQPIQQQGRRLPLLRSATTRATCLSRVFCCLTDIVQQIHSLRASGVKSSHRSSTDSSASIAWRKSVGIVCATPLEISDLDINPSYAG